MVDSLSIEATSLVLCAAKAVKSSASTSSDFFSLPKSSVSGSTEGVGAISTGVDRTGAAFSSSEGTLSKL